MDFVNLVLTAQAWPQGGVWESIIKWFSNGAGGKIAIAIILLTICLKVLMLPLDFWQKYNTRKMTQAQLLMKDELDAIKTKYKDQNVVNQKTMEVYKKHNFKPTSGCLPMLVYMVVTWVVFFTLFSSLGNISRTKVDFEYAQLQETYVASYDQAKLDGQSDEEAIVTAQGEVVAKYDQIREGFLSIKTIWRPDNWSSVFPNYNEFVNSTVTRFAVVELKDGEAVIAKYVVKQSNGDNSTDPYVTLDKKIYVTDQSLASVTINGIEYNQFVTVTPQGEQTIEDAIKASATDNFKTTFDTVTNGINNKYQGTWNGYLGLIILTAVITFLSQFLSSIGTKTRDKNGNQISGAKLNPVMGVVMAGIMVFFTISYTSMFALYIVTSNILSVVFSICINLVLNKIENNKDKKQKDKITPDYVRR